MMIVPPVKSQGIKTKLVPWILDLINRSGVDDNANWIEPFFGTGVVGFNSPLKGSHIVGDTNPHIIAFYQQILDGEIDSHAMRRYLEEEGRLLQMSSEEGYAHYKLVRERFNNSGNSLDFIFLSRTGFNGMMRFNRNGRWNVPFCKKPQRFAPAYITKICNQVDNVARIVHAKPWRFLNQSFEKTIEMAGEGDLIYCDPPYFGRYVDYYNGWSEQDEIRLFEALSSTKAKFILSTWHHNEFRSNGMLERLWGRFNVETREHFYHNGAHVENRHAMVEALIFNFEAGETEVRKPSRTLQPSLFDLPQRESLRAPKEIN